MIEFRVHTIFRAKKTEHYFRIINDFKPPSEYSAFLSQSMTRTEWLTIAYLSARGLRVNTLERNILHGQVEYLNVETCFSIKFLRNCRSKTGVFLHRPIIPALRQKKELTKRHSDVSFNLLKREERTPETLTRNLDSRGVDGAKFDLL